MKSRGFNEIRYVSNSNSNFNEPMTLPSTCHPKAIVLAEPLSCDLILINHILHTSPPPHSTILTVVSSNKNVIIIDADNLVIDQLLSVLQNNAHVSIDRLEDTRKGGASGNSHVDLLARNLAQERRRVVSDLICGGHYLLCGC